MKQYHLRIDICCTSSPNNNPPLDISPPPPPPPPPPSPPSTTLLVAISPVSVGEQGDRNVDIREDQGDGEGLGENWQRRGGGGRFSSERDGGLKPSK